MSLNIHHRRAFTVLAVTLALDAVLGVAYGHYMGIGTWHGIYCATGTATTVGCDIVPGNPASYVISFLMFITVVPLFASVFAFFTTGLTASHLDRTSGPGSGQDSV